MQEVSTSRRLFLSRLGLGALSIGAVSVMAACGKKEGGDGEAPKCDDSGLSDGAKATKASLKYVEKSTEAGKACKSCAQYVPPAGAGCGGCKLFDAGKGQVSPEGYCTGYAAKA